MSYLVLIRRHFFTLKTFLLFDDTYILEIEFLVMVGRIGCLSRQSHDAHCDTTVPHFPLLQEPFRTSDEATLYNVKKSCCWFWSIF